MVESINFDILRDRHPELVEHCAFAERYVHTDPQSALGKLRVFGELITRSFYDRENLIAPIDATFNDLLKGSNFRNSVPRVVVDKFHILRHHGNRAAHGEKVTVEMSPYDLSRGRIVLRN